MTTSRSTALAGTRWWAAAAAALLLGPAGLRAADYAWNVGNGSWATPGNWNPSGLPASGDNATISIAGSYTVTLGDNRAIGNLTINNSTATLSHTAGTLTVGNTLALTAGTYSLNGGTISGGSITSAGGLLKPGLTAGILNNVSVGLGVLDFTNFGLLRMQGTSTLAPGTTVALNAGSRIGFQQTTTLNNLTVNLAGFQPVVGVDGNNTLTLGSSTTITSTAAAGSNLTSGYFAAGTGVIQNQGLVRTTGGGFLTIDPTSFVNQSGGVVRATGGTVQIQTGGVINQAGGAFDVNGGTLNLLGTNWTNQGTITLSSGTLNLGGSFTTAGIGTLTRTGGTVMITGALDNSAATLALNATTGSYRLTQNGSITGGSITSSGGGQLQLFNGNSNRLNNVAVGLNVLNFDLPNGRVRFQGTSSLAAGTTLDLNGTFNIVGFEQTTTLNNLTVNLNTPGSALSVDGNNTLTLGSSTTVTSAGGVSISSGLLAGGTGVLQNQGLIRNTAGTLMINPSTFANQTGGGVRVSGGTISIPDTTTLTNVAAGTLTGGTWEVQGTATLDFGTRTVSTIGAGTTVELGGANATFIALNTLATNSGTFRVTGGTSFDPSGTATILNTGAIGVVEVGAASTLTSNLTVNGGGTLRGAGTVAGNVTYDTTGGSLRPGQLASTASGVLTVTGNLTLNANTTAVFALNGTAAGTGYDQLTVNGSVGLGNAVLSTTLGGGYTPAAGDKLFIVNNTSAGSIAGTFNGLPNGSTVTVGTTPFTISYFGDFGSQSVTGGNDVVLYVPVPEPGFVLAVAAAGLFVPWYLWRRAQATAR